ncbi:MAG: hypothetical protein RTU92_10795, partial [Candidatus Thorarchaeota archaeon]
MADDVCHVIFCDIDDVVLQDIAVEYTADLISLLRWPVARGQALFTDAGTYVTWSIFDDLDYGDLDFIRPYVAYKAARSTP